MSLLELDGVTKRFGDTAAVADLSLSVSPDELVCLLGPSGCGKSTTLRLVAGLDQPDTGRVCIDGGDVTERPPERRDCSLVFQDWALFPTKSVLQNVVFGLKMDGVGRAKRRERAREMLVTVEMAEYADTDPTELSGGQKQRVALARSLALDPSLLLLDEPLSNLDRTLRETMQLELAQLQSKLGTAMVYVTHDQDEAFTLADRMGIMRAGELVQVGRPETVYADPVDRFVESFLGSTTFIEGRLHAGEPVPLVETPLGTAPAPLGTDGATDGNRDDEPVVVSVRPESLTVEPTAGERPNPVAGESVDAKRVPDNTTTDGGAAGDSSVKPRGGAPTVETTGRIERVRRRGSTLQYRVAVGEQIVATERPAAGPADAAAGDAVVVRWCPERSRYFDPEGRRLR